MTIDEELAMLDAQERAIREREAAAQTMQTAPSAQGGRPMTIDEELAELDRQEREIRAGMGAQNAPVPAPQTPSAAPAPQNGLYPWEQNPGGMAQAQTQTAQTPVPIPQSAPAQDGVLPPSREQGSPAAAWLKGAWKGFTDVLFNRDAAKEAVANIRDDARNGGFAAKAGAALTDFGALPFKGAGEAAGSLVRAAGNLTGSDALKSRADSIDQYIRDVFPADAWQTGKVDENGNPREQTMLERVAQTAKDVGNIGFKFGAAGLAGPGGVYSLLGAESVNRYNEVMDEYNAAKAAGQTDVSEGAARAAAVGASAVDLVANLVMMKSVAGGATKAITTDSFRKFIGAYAKQNMLNAAKNAGIMGANAAVQDATANYVMNGDFDFLKTGKALADGIIDGVLFEAVSKAKHVPIEWSASKARMRRVRDAADAARALGDAAVEVESERDISEDNRRTDIARSALEGLGMANFVSQSPDVAIEMVAARRRGENVDLGVLDRIPQELRPAFKEQGDLNAFADRLMEHQLESQQKMRDNAIAAKSARRENAQKTAMDNADAAARDAAYAEREQGIGDALAEAEAQMDANKGRGRKDEQRFQAKTENEREKFNAKADELDADRANAQDAAIALEAENDAAETAAREGDATSRFREAHGIKPYAEWLNGRPDTKVTRWTYNKLFEKAVRKAVAEGDPLGNRVRAEMERNATQGELAPDFAASEKPAPQNEEKRPVDASAPKTDNVQGEVRGERGGAETKPKTWGAEVPKDKRESDAWADETNVDNSGIEGQTAQRDALFSRAKANRASDSNADSDYPVGTVVERDDGTRYIREEGEVTDYATGKSFPKWREVDGAKRAADQEHVFSSTKGGETKVVQAAEDAVSEPQKAQSAPDKQMHIISLSANEYKRLPKARFVKDENGKSKLIWEYPEEQSAKPAAQPEKVGADRFANAAPDETGVDAQTAQRNALFAKAKASRAPEPSPAEPAPAAPEKSAFSRMMDALRNGDAEAGRAAEGEFRAEMESGRFPTDAEFDAATEGLSDAAKEKLRGVVQWYRDNAKGATAAEEPKKVGIDWIRGAEDSTGAEEQMARMREVFEEARAKRAEEAKSPEPAPAVPAPTAAEVRESAYQTWLASQKSRNGKPKRDSRAMRMQYEKYVKEGKVDAETGKTVAETPAAAPAEPVAEPAKAATEQEPTTSTAEGRFPIAGTDKTAATKEAADAASSAQKAYDKAKAKYWAARANSNKHYAKSGKTPRNLVDAEDAARREKDAAWRKLREAMQAINDRPHSPSTELAAEKSRIDSMPETDKRTRDAKKRAQKNWLLKAVDEAIAERGEGGEDLPAERRRLVDENAKLEGKKYAAGTMLKNSNRIADIDRRIEEHERIVFDVPDDGQFFIYNSPYALKLFKSQVQKRLAPTTLKETTIKAAEKPLVQDIREGGAGDAEVVKPGKLKVVDGADGRKTFAREGEQGAQTENSPTDAEWEAHRKEQTARYEKRLGQDFVKDWDAAMTEAKEWDYTSGRLQQGLFPSEEMTRDKMLDQALTMWRQNVDASFRHTVGHRPGDNIWQKSADALEKLLVKYGVNPEEGGKSKASTSPDPSIPTDAGFRAWLGDIRLAPNEEAQSRRTFEMMVKAGKVDGATGKEIESSVKPSGAISASDKVSSIIANTLKKSGLSNDMKKNLETVSEAAEELDRSHNIVAVKQVKYDGIFKAFLVNAVEGVDGKKVDKQYWLNPYNGTLMAPSPDGIKVIWRPRTRTPLLDEFVKVSDGKGGRISPSEAADNGSAESVQSLVKMIRSNWGSEGGKYNEELKSLAAAVMNRDSRKLDGIIGDLYWRMNRGAKSLAEYTSLVTPADPTVENGYTPAQKYRAEMNRWQMAEEAARKYGVENTYPKPEKPEDPWIPALRKDKRVKALQKKFDSAKTEEEKQSLRDQFAVIREEHKSEWEKKNGKYNIDEPAPSTTPRAAADLRSMRRGEQVLVDGLADNQRATFLKDNGDGTAQVQVRTTDKANPYASPRAETRTVKAEDIRGTGIGKRFRIDANGKEMYDEATPEETEKANRAAGPAFARVAKEIGDVFAGTGADAEGRRARLEGVDGPSGKVRGLREAVDAANAVLPADQRVAWVGNVAKYLDDAESLPIANGTRRLSGMESTVVRRADGKIVKAVWINDANGYTIPQALNKISAYNALFGDRAPMKCIGFGEGIGGKTYAIFEQKFVDGGRHIADGDASVEGYLRSIDPTFRKLDPEGTAYESDRFFVSDLHARNMLKGDNGEVNIIDANVFFKNSPEGRDAMRRHRIESGSPTVADAEGATPEMVDRLAERMRKFIPGVKVDVGELSDGAKASGASAEYDRGTNTARLRPDATLEDAFHELGGHGVWQWAEQHCPELLRRAVDYARGAPKELRERIFRDYGEFDGKALVEELFSHRVESEGVKAFMRLERGEGAKSGAERKWAVNLANAVRAVFQSAAKRNGVDLERLRGKGTEEFVRGVLDQMVAGRDLNEWTAYGRDAKWFGKDVGVRGTREDERYRVRHMMNINDDTQPFSEELASGEKTIETRGYLYKPWKDAVGDRIGFVRTGKGRNAEVVGGGELTRVFKFTYGDGNPNTDWLLLRGKTKIAEGSAYDWDGKTGEKWGYEFVKPTMLKNPIPAKEYEKSNYIKGRTTEDDNLRFRIPSAPAVAPEEDKAYMDAAGRIAEARKTGREAEPKDIDTVSKINGLAAIIKTPTLFKDKNGNPLILFHGSNNFGNLVFDKKPLMFTTDSASRASGYGGPGQGIYRGLSRRREVEPQELIDTGTPVQKIVAKANSVLGAGVKVATAEDKVRSFDSLRKVFEKVAQKVDSLSAKGDPSEELDQKGEWDFYNRTNSIMWSLWMDESDWTALRDSIMGGSVENSYLREQLMRDTKGIHDRYNDVRGEYFDRVREKLSDQARQYYDGFFNGYDVGDAMVDAQYSFRNLLDDKNDIVRSNGSVLNKKDLVDNINNEQGSGIYGFYVDAGEKPLMVDAKGAHWTSIPFNGKKMSTDDIGNWAKDNGYTSVRIDNVQDPGVQNADGSDYITFHPSQIKSADPVTFDDAGNPIPLSERFRTDREGADAWRNSDIRYRRAGASDLGYHYGDLGRGRDTTRGNMGGRSTGHFGTGTYFFGDKPENGYGGRPEHAVDFSKYKMARPKNADDAEVLHGYLKRLNDHYGFGTPMSAEDIKSGASRIENLWEKDDIGAKDIEQAISDARRISEKGAAMALARTVSNGQADYAIANRIARMSPAEVVKMIRDRDMADGEDFSDVAIKFGTHFGAEANSDYDNPNIRAGLSLDNGQVENVARILGKSPDEVRAAANDIIVNGVDTAEDGDSASTVFMKRLGFDGVDVRGIKEFDNARYGSVLYNITDNSVRYRRAGTPVPAGIPARKRYMDKESKGAEKMKEWWSRNLADRYSPVRDAMVDALMSDGKTHSEALREVVNDENSGYHAKRVAPGKVQKQIQRFEAVKSILTDKLGKDLAKEGLDIWDVGAWMWMKHAPARNKMLAKNGVVDGAGVSDADAYSLTHGGKVSDVFGKDRQYTPEQMRMLDDVRVKVLQRGNKEFGPELLLNAGLIDRQTLDNLKPYGYDHVVLADQMTEDGIDYAGSGTSVSNPLKKARGRKNPMEDNPMVSSMVAWLNNVANAQKNMDAEKFAQFVGKHPEMGEVRTMTPMDKVDSASIVFRRNVQEFDENGNAVKDANGNDVFTNKKMIVHLYGRRGAEVAKAFNDSAVVRSPSIVQSAMRAYASTATSLSPTFSVGNMLKDTMEVFNDVMSTQGAGAALRFLNNQVSTFPLWNKDFRDAMREFRKTGEITGNTEIAKQLKEFVDSGSVIGGMAREGYGDTLNALKKASENLGGAKGALKAFKSIAKLYVDKVGAMNEYIEMLSRFNNYRTRRTGENGVWGGKGAESIGEAAINSREGSTDFNMYGNQRWLNDVYMFSNSILGGTARAAKSLTVGKYGRRMMVALVAMGVLEEMANAAMNDDEDAEKRGDATEKDVTEYDRENSLRFRAGGTLVKLPMHFGPYSIFKYAGNNAYRVMAGQITMEEALKNVSKAIGKVASHLTGTGEHGIGKDEPHPFATLTPTIAQPVVQVAVNRDYKGDPIYREHSLGAAKHTPDWIYAKPKTNKAWVELSRMLNNIPLNNGSDLVKGNYDIAPEALEYLSKQVFKNFGTDVMNAVVDMPTAAMQTIRTGENQFAMKDVPGLRRVVKDASNVAQRYYEVADTHAREHNAWNLAKGKDKREYLRGHPTAGYNLAKIEDSVKRLQALARGEVLGKDGKVVSRRELTTAQKEAYEKRARAQMANYIRIVEGRKR